MKQEKEKKTEKQEQRLRQKRSRLRRRARKQKKKKEEENFTKEGEKEKQSKTIFFFKLQSDEMTLSGKTLQWKEKVTKGGISLLKRKERRSQARAKQQTRSNNWPVISYTACKRKKEKEHPRSLIVESKRQKKKELRKGAENVCFIGRKTTFKCSALIWRQ